MNIDKKLLAEQDALLDKYEREIAMLKLENAKLKEKIGIYEITDFSKIDIGGELLPGYLQKQAE